MRNVKFLNPTPLHSNTQDSSLRPKFDCNWSLDTFYFAIFSKRRGAIVEISLAEAYHLRLELIGRIEGDLERRNAPGREESGQSRFGGGIRDEVEMKRILTVEQNGFHQRHNDPAKLRPRDKFWHNWTSD